MSKRANGEGTVFQRESDGRWVGRISLGQDATGKRIRKTVYGKTQKEALDKIDDLKQQVKLNMKAIVARESLAAYLNWWLENDVAVNRASKTYEEYEASVRLQSIPFIGHIKLSKIDGDDLIAWQAKLKRNKFSNNQRLRSIRVLRNAPNKAVKHRKIPFNPCIEARKYRLNLTIANQYLEQVDKAVLAAVFGNVGSFLSFQVGARDAEEISQQFGNHVTPRDMIQLPKYHAYMRLMVEGATSKPFSLTTLPSNPLKQDRSAIVRRQSRQRYTRPGTVVQEEVNQQFAMAH